MFVSLQSATLVGIRALPVEVEVDVARGLPNFVVVGLADSAIRESKERIRSAIKNCGCRFPARRITINLAPADLRKEGTALDLPAAIGIIAGEREALRASPRLREYLFCGELSLDGRVKPIRGALPLALAARDGGCRGIFLPRDNAVEAAVIAATGVRLEIVPVTTLNEVLEIIEGTRPIPAPPPPTEEKTAGPGSADFAEVRGQPLAKRGLEIAAAGGHNLLFIGPPGSGKTMLARRLPSILPELSFAEALESTIIHSVAGLVPPGGGLLREPPFRQPHHTISDVALIGGGANPRPGEVTLAHNGVLFLDEVPEFRRATLEVLRQPLENRRITIARAQARAEFPASFILVAAMNPCPCGHLGDRFHPCTCTATQIQRYRQKLSGPLLDRIDLHIEVPAVEPEELIAPDQDPRPENSAVIRERVRRARERQRRRRPQATPPTNAGLSDREIARFCALDHEGRKLLRRAMERLGLSARAYSRVLKVARTIADLAGRERITSGDLAEAIQFRALDRRASF